VNQKDESCLREGNGKVLHIISGGCTVTCCEVAAKGEAAIPEGWAPCTLDRIVSRFEIREARP